ncbi:bifunctional 2-methylcitrate synthase/citrate synthase [Kribbella sandramycini]|uniref:Citrate synthase n=1 Tax=Kribbella sandramycini TaxID=60450 RepID=A0A7Y4KX85_9ACTN|nr:bifunctional 2-methylcitrate synthase/citrate synthase [Kribbella sandramycini]MBB6569847.1 citrate synthase [Kribbella sandramycini]NOL40328.1 bifunctional 2-methylcitrate synthase/citrate synthase [Kribbella sandramycini]
MTEIHRGLAGVVVDTTTISMVNEQTNSLTYRGYPVQELCANCTFEEVAWLLWHGELPTARELAEFQSVERNRRTLGRTVSGALSRLPADCHPMDVLRTAISYLGADDPTEGLDDRDHNLAKSIDMFAKLPTIVAAEQRRRRGLDPILPDPALGYAENFLQMCIGAVPPAEQVRAFEVSMILYAEHSFNASTFTARVVTSTLSDIYSAVTAAIGALKGPLHGGANEAVMHVLAEIESAGEVEAWLKQALADKRKIMGFGHRVYKNGDSRVPTMTAELRKLTADGTADELMAKYDALAAAMLRDKNIHPNLDYPTGPAYHLMGFDIPIFTPLFMMSRITGWTAHIMEQLESNSLIRPLSSYVGVDQRPVPAGAARLVG